MSNKTGKIFTSHESNYFGGGYQKGIKFSDGTEYRIRNSHLSNYFGGGYQQEIVPVESHHYGGFSAIIYEHFTKNLSKTNLLLLDIMVYFFFFLAAPLTLGGAIVTYCYSFILGLCMMLIVWVDVMAITIFQFNFQVSCCRSRLIALTIMELMWLTIVLMPILVGVLGGYTDISALQL